MRVLRNKERQIREMESKIEKIEGQNDMFDNMGKVKRDPAYDFDFGLDLEGSQRDRQTAMATGPRTGKPPRRTNPTPFRTSRSWSRGRSCRTRSSRSRARTRSWAGRRAGTGQEPTGSSRPRASSSCRAWVGKSTSCSTAPRRRNCTARGSTTRFIRGFSVE